MNNQPEIQPVKKLVLSKITLHLLTDSSSSRALVPTEGCTGTCGSGLCFVVNDYSPAVRVVVSESK